MNKQVGLWLDRNKAVIVSVANNIEAKHIITSDMEHYVLYSTIVLAAFGFRAKEGVPENLKICKKGTWNERMCVETVLSMLTIVCDLKRIRHRLVEYIQARLAYVAAMFNILLALFRRLLPEADPFKMSIAEFSL